MGRYYTTGGFMASAVQCPFFKGSEEKTVVCEGWMNDSILEQRFSRKQLKMDFVREWCCERYQECEIYKLCMRKYE